MSEQTASSTFRDNAPLYGVSAILLAAFAALALFGTQPVERAANPAATSGMPPPLASLPATDTALADDDSELAPETARQRNDAVPFIDGPLGPAPPFAFAGDAASRARATECLALAAMAEAGSDDAGQRAVMQVVLNRVRHPAFPNTVCGVVFEGSQRRTGCQFTFTCDGSLSRRYSDGYWAISRKRAAEMLGGSVFGRVGNATHYHTDWVYPWWSDKLDKVAQVDTHLFFRWRGYWGGPRALSARYMGGEPTIASLTRASEDETVVSELPAPETPRQPVVTIRSDKRVEGTIAAGPGAHFLALSGSEDPASLTARAEALCPGESYCQVYGWTDGSAIPSALPLGREARRSLSFSYLAPRAGNPAVVYFDCTTYAGVDRARCLPRARN